MGQNEKAAAPPWSEWLEQFRTSLPGFGQGPSVGGTIPPAFRALSEHLENAPQWQQALEHWVERALETLRQPSMGMPGMPPTAAAMAQAMHQWLQDAASPGGAPASETPILGLAPEQQQHWRRLASELESWRETAQRCASLGNAALAEALLRWHRKTLRTRTLPDCETLWEGWLGELDESHQALLKQPRFLRALATMEQHGANARGLAVALLEPLWHELGLATRSDLDGLAQRSREQQARDARQIQCLREELASLRAEMHQLRGRAHDAD
ncbi:MAG: hypothetical protein JJU06_02380 [Ectothiorhodospiraceae bacterium]|nr:hypothetical protein [Ectothiorhodospiraceae bacterium]